MIILVLQRRETWITKRRWKPSGRNTCSLWFPAAWAAAEPSTLTASQCMNEVAKDQRSSPFRVHDWRSSPFCVHDWRSGPFCFYDWRSSPLCDHDWRSSPFCIHDGRSSPFCFHDCRSSPFYAYDWRSSPFFFHDWRSSPFCFHDWTNCCIFPCNIMTWWRWINNAQLWLWFYIHRIILSLLFKRFRNRVDRPLNNSCSPSVRI